MIHIFVKIHVKDFTALEKFEHEAAKLMVEHKGKILTAFETERNNDGSGFEIHILEFQNHEHFLHYRQDTRLQALSELRSQAISAIEVNISTQLKYYT